MRRLAKPPSVEPELAARPPGPVLGEQPSASPLATSIAAEVATGALRDVEPASLGSQPAGHRLDRVQIWAASPPAPPPPPVQRELDNLPVQRDGPLTLQTPSLLDPPDPAARYRLGGENHLHLDPAIEAMARQHIQQQLDPAGLRPALARVRVGSVRLPPVLGGSGSATGGTGAAPNPLTGPPTPQPAPLVPPGAGPDTPRQADPDEVLSAIMAVPQIDQGLTTLRTQATDRIAADWRRLSTGEKVGAVSTVAVIALGALGGAVSNPESRRWALGQLNGRVLPVPGVDWLHLEVNTAGDNVMVGMHVDVGQLLPKSWGFGAGSPTAIGGPPQPAPFVPGQRSIDRSGGADGAARLPGGSTVAQRIAASSAAGEPLSDGLRTRLESGVDANLTNVRIHTGAESDQLARSVDATAFTSGRDIFFRAGAYAPSSPEGYRLLAHEATHTVQQAAGPVSGTPTAGGVSLSDPSDRFERAAELVADRAVARDREGAGGGHTFATVNTYPSGGVVQRTPFGPAAPSPAPGSPAQMVSELGPGAPVEPSIAGHAGQAFGADLGRVQVHTGPAAARLASMESATAVAVGEHVAFAEGAYQPNTPVGDALIAHELAHVAQQRDAGPATAAAKPVERAPAGDLEAEADQAAGGVMARVYGGIQTGVKELTRGPMALRRCGSGTRPVPTDPFLARLHAKLYAAPRDTAGYWGEVGTVGTTRAGDAVVRTGIETFVRDGKLSRAEGFRTICLLELGPERGWPLPVKNFAQGVDSGTFTVSVMPPAGADPLREFCVSQAGVAAEGAADVRANYRTAFNSRWESARVAALLTEFDASIPSKGPRNQRAHFIFDELYAIPAYRTAYDTNAPAGFREMADTHVAPDGVNLTASPRLQDLRATLAPPLVTASGTGDAAYTALVGLVRPKAEALDPRDRQEIERSHQWRLAIDAKVNGTTPAATGEVRADLWHVATTSRSAAPVGPAPVPAGPVAPEPAPTPNAAQSTWLGGITLAAPPSPSRASTAEHPLPFLVRSTVPNPGLGVRRKVVVEPAGQVASGQEDETAWAAGSAAADHTAEVNPEAAGGGPTTVFTAHLTMPPLPTATFAEKTKSVTVEDKRQDWFKTNVRSGLTFTDQNQPTAVSPGDAIHYYGGQCPLGITPSLGAGDNPGLNVAMDGTLKKVGAVVETFTRSPFPGHAKKALLFNTILREPSPAPVAPEAMEAAIKFYIGSGAVPFHTITVPFTLAASPPVGGDAAAIVADNAWLNGPIATAGTLLHHMDAQGGTAQRVAQAVSTGVLRIAACSVRTDSATVVAASGQSPASKVAYAMGVVDPPGIFTHTLIAQPGAVGWRWSALPGIVFLNATPTIGGPHRPLDKLSEFLTHEGIHAADRNAGAPGDWDRYATEFRAYWIMGTGAGLSTAPDPEMSGLGPKSPRARAIFNHVYGSPTYPFVKPAYDSNASGFRERADNYLYPDGINLTLSQKLATLRRDIESYSGLAPDYAAKRAVIVAGFAACAVADKAEIRGNREWRDLVESKFTTRVVPGVAPAITERDDIKTELAVPR